MIEVSWHWQTVTCFLLVLVGLRFTALGLYATAQTINMAALAFAVWALVLVFSNG